MNLLAIARAGKRRARTEGEFEGAMKALHMMCPCPRGSTGFFNFLCSRCFSATGSVSFVSILSSDDANSNVNDEESPDCNVESSPGFSPESSSEVSSRTMPITGIRVVGFQ